MINLEDEVNRAIEQLVAQISHLAHIAAVDTLNTALERSMSGSPREGGGSRRSSAELASLSERVTACIRANPGLHIEEINQHLGTTTGQLRGPVHRLILDGVVITKGKRRGRTYYVRATETPRPWLSSPLPGFPTSPSPEHALLTLTAPVIQRVNELGIDDGDHVDPGWSRCLSSVFAFARKLNE